MNNPIDWKAFEYKFSGDSRAAFESLAYILFCYEFKQTYGIFRYYNQPYIETQPANTADGHKVGFQAKYYDAGTQMSSKEQDLKDAIKGAKNKYVGIDRIIFYINREFSASSAKDKDKPEHQIRIEKYGKNLGIEIQWRGQSHIEKMLAMEELKYVKNLYFNVETGIDYFHESLINHKNSILKHIHSTIKYGEKDIKIAQDYQKLTNFQESDAQVLIIHGAAGAGKSATVKDFLEAEKDQREKITLMFTASDLDVKEENLFLRDGNYGLQDLFGLYKNEEHRLCIIDSAEKYCTAKYPKVFGDILRQFLDHGWKILITIRTFYKDSFCNTFLGNCKYSEQEIPKLKKETLTEINIQYPFVLPTDPKVQDLLCNMFYLNLYLNMDHSSEDENMNVTLFRDAIWNQVIRNDFQQYNNLPVKRETFVLQMVCDMLAHERYTYPMKATDDFETVSALENSGIIIPYHENRKNWMMSHDVYEEIVTNHVFTERLEQDTYPEKTFFTGLGNSLRSRKSYRIWLESQLADGEDWILQFLLDLFNDEELGLEWKDETLIALMNSESEEGYFILDTLLSQSGQELFARMMFLLNTACRGGMDPEILELLNEQKETEFNQYRYTRPKGTAWETLLKYTCDNQDRIDWSEKTQQIVIAALYTWTHAVHEGEATRTAGLIALYLRKKIYTASKYKYDLENNDVYKKLDNIILNAAKEIKEELDELFTEVIQTNALDHRSEYYPLIEKAISNVIDCGMTYAAIPETLIKLLKCCWIHSEPELSWDTHPDLESDFGLKEHLNFRYYPVSALQTPVHEILAVAPQQGMNFVLNLLNYASECYRKSSLATEYGECQEIELIFSETKKVKQICSDRLWKMHRGTAPNPHVLECVLMALERWLLEIAENFPEELLNKICLFLLKNSNNVAITATVLSVVEAYPEKLFEISCILLRTKEIFYYDIRRWAAEDANAIFFKGYSSGYEIMLIQDAIIKLNRWVNLTDSVDAHYYRFILKFIQAIEGSTLAEGELPKLLRELKHTAANKYNRTVPQHWLSKNGKGINALITNNRNRRNAVPEDEMSEILLPFIGRISNNYVNDSHAYINWHGVDVYFNPSATKGEISKINIGQRVRFGLGFSYDGPRAYNSSIKLLGKDEFVEVKREIESGIAVKCEVTKNVTHYVQVRIIGFSEIGSIYVNELVEPYSANNRPDIGTILDGKILMKKFDNAKHCNVWQITMNMNDIKEESKEETAMAQAIRLSGIKVR